jgi:hypothetical protein
MFQYRYGFAKLSKRRKRQRKAAFSNGIDQHGASGGSKGARLATLRIVLIEVRQSSSGYPQL